MHLNRGFSEFRWAAFFRQFVTDIMQNQASVNLFEMGPGWNDSGLDSIGWHWKVVDLLRWHRICRTKLRDSSKSRRYLTRFDHLLGFEDDPSIFDGFGLTKLGRNSSTLSLWFMNLRRLNCQKVHRSTKFLPFGDWEAIAAGNQKGFGHLWPGFV